MAIERQLHDSYLVPEIIEERSRASLELVSTPPQIVFEREIDLELVPEITEHQAEISEKQPEINGRSISAEMLSLHGFGLIRQIRERTGGLIVADLRIDSVDSMTKRLVRKLSMYKPDIITVDSLCGPEMIASIVALVHQASKTKVFVIPVMPNVTNQESKLLHGQRDLGPALAFRSYQALRAGADGVVCWSNQLHSIRDCLRYNGEREYKILLNWGSEVGQDPHPTMSTTESLAGEKQALSLAEVATYDDVLITLETDVGTGATSSKFNN